MQIEVDNGAKATYYKSRSNFIVPCGAHRSSGTFFASDWAGDRAPKTFIVISGAHLDEAKLAADRQAAAVWSDGLSATERAARAEKKTDFLR